MRQKRQILEQGIAREQRRRFLQLLSGGAVLLGVGTPEPSCITIPMPVPPRPDQAGHRKAGSSSSSSSSSSSTR